MFNLSELKIIHDALLTLLLLDLENNGENSRTDELEEILLKSGEHVAELQNK